MGLLFSKKKTQSRITDHDKVVLQLKQQRDKIKQYQKRIEIKLTTDRELARKLLNDGKKDRAKLLLRKKRFQEQLLKTTDGHLENLEKMTHDLEFAQIEIQVLDGLKEGNAALKKVNEVLNIDEIEKILDETREAADKQREIDELLSGTLTTEDEDAVQAELDQIIGEMLPEVPETTDQELELELPNVPETELIEDLPSAGKEKVRQAKEKIAVPLEA